MKLSAFLQNPIIVNTHLHRAQLHLALFRFHSSRSKLFFTIKLTNVTVQKVTSTNQISNYAKKNYECEHNLVYWQGGDYLGIGAGAHSRIYFNQEAARSGIVMLHEPIAWLKKVQETGAGIQKIEKITREELAEELILMGLRLKDGIDNKIFQTHFNKKLTDIFDFKKLQILANQGLIQVSENQIKITESARLLTNLVIQKVCQARRNF